MPQTESALARLLGIMARLRDPKSGCPWDIEQSFATIAPYTIEEAYEVADVIARGDLNALKEELGDLLLQVVFHARMAEERGLFDFGAVAEAISDKMVRRHPHVFGNAKVKDEAEQRQSWESIKAAERRQKTAETADAPTSALDGVPVALPGLSRAVKLSDRAARIGFDWPDAAQVIDKMEEEILELRQAIAGKAKSEIESELGDLLFGMANLARKLGVDPESGLRRTNRKFESRFKWMESRLRESGEDPKVVGLERLEALWVAAKKAEPGR